MHAYIRTWALRSSYNFFFFIFFFPMTTKIALDLPWVTSNFKFHFRKEDSHSSDISSKAEDEAVDHVHATCVKSEAKRRFDTSDDEDSGKIAKENFFY